MGDLRVRGDAFREVYEVVALGAARRRPPSPEAIEAAARNKVLLEFLRRAAPEHPLRAREEARLRRLAGFVAELSRALRGLDAVFFKLVKPVAYVPADVDLLVRREHLAAAVSRARLLGLSIEVAEPYCVTMAGRGFVVDFYVHPTLGGVAYADGARLLEHAGVVSFHGVEVRSLEPHAEVVVSAAHALYKEAIYTLNDMVTISAWLSRRALRLAEELECMGALRAALAVNEAVRRGRAELPLRLSPPLWAALLASKAASDPLTRSTALRALGALSSRRVGRLALSRLTRRSY